VNKMTKKGWHGEKFRHSISRKGIKSRGYAIKGERIIHTDYEGYTLEQAQKRLEEIKEENKAFWTPERLKAKKKIDDAIEKEKNKRRIEFKTHVVTENSFGIVNDYGIVNNLMILNENIYKHNWDSFGNYNIEWAVMDENNDIIDYTEIGIWTKGKNVIEYDGVFKLPKEALKLLKKNGFKTKDIE